MNNKISLLACALALQLMVALIVFWSGGHSDSFKAEPLVAVDQSEIDRIVIRDSDSEVELVKSAESWELSEPASLPVEESRLNSLLTQLSSLESTWPVSTTTASHERFEVSEDKFNRHISLYSKGDKVTELFVGTSPGFKKAHIRQEKSDEVYALEFSAYEASATDKDWLDKSLLALPSVKRIKGRDFELVKEENSWSWSGAPLTAELDQAKAKELSEAIDSLRVTAVAKESPEVEAVKSLSIYAEDGNSYTFELFAKEDDYFIKRSDLAQVFTLSKYEYEKLAEPALSSLSEAQTTDDEPTSSNAEEESKTSDS